MMNNRDRVNAEIVHFYANKMHHQNFDVSQDTNVDLKNSLHLLES